MKHYTITTCYWDHYYEQWLMTYDKLGKYNDDIDAIEASTDYVNTFFDVWKSYCIRDDTGRKIMTKRKLF